MRKTYSKYGCVLQEDIPSKWPVRGENEWVELGIPYQSWTSEFPQKSAEISYFCSGCFAAMLRGSWGPRAVFASTWTLDDFGIQFLLEKSISFDSLPRIEGSIREIYRIPCPILSLIFGNISVYKMVVFHGFAVIFSFFCPWNLKPIRLGAAKEMQSTGAMEMQWSHGYWQTAPVDARFSYQS